MRLTKKYDDNSGYEIVNEEPREQHLYIDLNAYEECVSKLGQLEDIEDELGIDLSILPRLLRIKPKDIIYVKQKGVIVECEVTDNALIDGTLIVFSHYHIGHTIYTPVCHYNEYGKTWALTREELL